MATVEITKHLWEFLPSLRGKTLNVEAATVADVVREVERVAPGFTYAGDSWVAVANNLLPIYSVRFG